MVWKLSARSTARATWLATAESSSRSAAPTRPGSLDVTESTPNTSPLTRSGTRTTERVPNARALGTSMGWSGASTSSTTRGRPVTATRAAPARGSSSGNSMARNRVSASTPPAVR